MTVNRREAAMSHFGGPVEGAGARLVRAVRRPAGAAAVAREAVGTVVTAGLWPIGLAGGLRPGWSRIGGSGHERAAVPAGHRTPAPVLLLHGYGANSSYWFSAARALTAVGFPVHAFDCQLLRHDIPAAAALCVDRSRKLMRAHGVDRIHLVGHSAGGIVLRHAVQLDGLHEASTAVTVAAPHRGAMLARCAPGPTARQLRPGSDLLAALAAAPAAPGTRFVSYHSNMDVIVPGRAAMLLRPDLAAVNHLVKDVGHLSVLYSEDFHRSLAEELLITEGRIVRLAARVDTGDDADEAMLCTDPAVP